MHDYINYLNSFISQKPKDNNKYIFIVNNLSLCENIICIGYLSIIVNNDNIEEFADIISKNHIGYKSEYIFVLSSNKSINDSIAELLKSLNIQYDNTEAWKLFNNKKRNINYYCKPENNQHLQEVIENYIKKCEGKEEKGNHGFKLQDGTNKITFEGLDYEAFAKYITKEHHIVKIEDSLYYYLDGLYHYLSDEDFDRILMKETYNSKINQRKEVNKYIRAYAEVKKASNKRYILFKNGVYDLITGQLLPLSEEYVFFNAIPHNYNLKCVESDEYDKFLNDLACNDRQVVTLLHEFVGYSMYRSNPFGTIFFIVGNGGNGKSTFFDILSYIIGEDNVSHVELDDLQGFELVKVKGKLLNISDDVDNGFIRRVSILKKMATGEPILAGAKFKDKEEMRFYGKELIAGNEIPKMNDTTGGLKRRLKILPFNADFKSNPDINIKDKLFNEKVAEYAILTGIQCLTSVLQDKGFTQCNAVNEATEDYHKENNHIIQFIEDNTQFIETKSIDTLYSTFYKSFCETIGCHMLGRTTFIRRICEEGFKKVQASANTGFNRSYMFKRKNT